MLRHVRTAGLARLAAALVAVTLSGAPRVLAPNAPPERHHCTCRAHSADHACDCALCRKAALTAQAGDERLPPCHREAARKELAASPGIPRGEPCVEGTCGDGARPTLTLAGVEDFVLPQRRPLAVALPEPSIPACEAPPSERALEPETPPPRRA